MTTKKVDVQGYLLGVLPYDFRFPTLSKLVRRLWFVGGPMFPPKAFGAGWTLNLAHRGSQLLLTGLVALALLARFVG